MAENGAQEAPDDAQRVQVSAETPAEEGVVQAAAAAPAPVPPAAPPPKGRAPRDGATTKRVKKGASQQGAAYEAPPAAPPTAPPRKGKKATVRPAGIAS